MSFSDLMSSSKGPGLIGLLLALLVLVGFGTLYTLAFDQNTPTGKSIEAVIRDNAKTIATYQAQLDSGNATLATAPALENISSNLAADIIKNQLISERVTLREAEVEHALAEIQTLESEWEDYQNQYRGHVREKAVGEQIAELKALDGTLYTQVEIRKVTAIGMDIRHLGGFKRIPYAELPLDLQDHFQFDENQMLAQSTREFEIRKDHNMKVEAAQKAAAEENEKIRLQKAEENRKKSQELITRGKARAKQIESEIRALQSDISNAERAASAAKSAGKIHINKSNIIRGDLSRKRTELLNVQNEINRLESSL